MGVILTQLSSNIMISMTQFQDQVSSALPDEVFHFNYNYVGVEQRLSYEASNGPNVNNWAEMKEAGNSSWDILYDTHRESFTVVKDGWDEKGDGAILGSSLSESMRYYK